MFESLTSKLLETLRVLKGSFKLSDEVLDELCRQLRTNLLDADVNVKVVKDFMEGVRSRASSIQIQKGVSPEQQFIRILYEELSRLMGGQNTELNLSVTPPAVILVAGLQGAGKTTTVGKLAKLLSDSKKRVMVASVDIHRPAAIEQLKIITEPLKVYSFDSPVLDSARERALLAKEEAIKQGVDVLLVDTAGRLHLDDEMMEELEEVVASTEPNETLFVLDAMTGQSAVDVAMTFHQRVSLTGVILTKLDGDTRGGAALSIKAMVGCPIKFIGTGEKVSDLDTFHPDRMASRILDMGDLLSLAEKAKSTLDPIESMKLAKKIKKNEFTMADFYLHLQQIKKMGSFENLLKFLPGVGKISKDLSQMAPPDTEIKKIEAIILSMTAQERVDHSLLNGSRRKRIASGSGTKVEDVNRLIRQFLETKKMMSRFSKSPMGKTKGLW